jgi:hypothetical protein
VLSDGCVKRVALYVKEGQRYSERLLPYLSVLCASLSYGIIRVVQQKVSFVWFK